MSHTSHHYHHHEGKSEANHFRPLCTAPLSGGPLFSQMHYAGLRPAVHEYTALCFDLYPLY